MKVLFLILFLFQSSDIFLQNIRALKLEISPSEIRPSKSQYDFKISASEDSVYYHLLRKLDTLNQYELGIRNDIEKISNRNLNVQIVFDYIKMFDNSFDDRLKFFNNYFKTPGQFYNPIINPNDPFFSKQRISSINNQFLYLSFVYKILKSDSFKQSDYFEKDEKKKDFMAWCLADKSVDLTNYLLSEYKYATGSYKSNLEEVLKVMKSRGFIQDYK